MFMIRDLKENDYEQKAYVHFQSWKETYRRLMEARYLEKHTLEKCIQSCLWIANTASTTSAWFISRARSTTINTCAWLAHHAKSSLGS